MIRETVKNQKSSLLPVVVAVNSRYVQHLCAAVKSVLVNNQGLTFRFYVINSGIPDRIFDRLRNVVSEGPGSEVIDLQVPDSLYEGMVLTHYYSREIYYRLLIPELVNEDRVLYLDSDIIVNGPIGELFDYDLDGFCAGAVREPWFNRHDELGLAPGHRYFNSGVLLINVRKWREEGLHRKVVEYIAENHRVIVFPDQDGLNAIIGDRYIPLPLKYNLTFMPHDADTIDCGLYGDDELEEARKSPVIIHFSGGSKPWNIDNRHDYKELYWKYLRMTPYRFSLPDELVPRNLFRRMIPQQLKSSIRKLVGMN